MQGNGLKSSSGGLFSWTNIESDIVEGFIALIRVKSKKRLSHTANIAGYVFSVVIHFHNSAFHPYQVLSFKTVHQSSCWKDKI